MRRTLVATMLAIALGLISMPATQAAPTNGQAIGSAADATSSVVQAQYYRRGRYRRNYRRWGRRW